MSKSSISIVFVVICYQFALIGLNVIPIGFNGVLQSFDGNGSNIDFLVSFAMTGAMSMALIIFAIPIGFFANSFSHKKIFLISGLLISISGFVGYFSSNIYHFLFGRIIFGFGFLLSDMMFSVLILENSKNSKEGSKNFSLGNAANMLGNITYTLAAGLVHPQSWRLSHAVLAFSILLLPGCMKIIPESIILRNKKNVRKFAFLKSIDSSKTFIFVIAHIAVLTMLGLIAITTPTITSAIKNGHRLNGVLISTMWVGAAISSSFYRRILKNPNPMNSYLTGATMYCIGLGMLFGITNEIIPLTFTKYFMLGMGLGMIFSNAFLLLLEVANVKQTSLISSCISFSMGIGYVLSPVLKKMVINQNGQFYKASVLCPAFIAVMLVLLKASRIKIKKPYK